MSSSTNNASASGWIRGRERKASSSNRSKDKQEGETLICRENQERHDQRQMRPIITSTPTTSLMVALPFWGRLTLRLLLGTTATLYALNQKHMLPKPLSSIVSKALFWPTLPVTVSSRIGEWMTDIDEAVVMGGAPFGFLGFPERLRDDYGVRGIINMCDEYKGPVAKYNALGMKELWLRTVDHFEPSFVDLKRAVSFIEETEKRNGGRVYIHCRAGHGRSAATVFAWLLYQDPNQDLESLNKWLVSKRNVRKSLYKQANIRRFHAWASARQSNPESDRSIVDEDQEYDEATTSFYESSDEDEDLL